MKLHSNKTHLIVDFALILIVITLYLMVYKIPANMDEFSMFHRLACWLHPSLDFNVFREGCNQYPSKLFGINFHRSFSYIGITSSYFFWPFYKMWPSYLVSYAVGTLCILIFSFAIVRQLKLRYQFMLIPLSYIQLVFLLIHDAGPIRLAILSIPFLGMFFHLAITNHGSKLYKFLLATSCALYLSVCVEDKPFYIYILPAAILMGLSLAIFREDKLDLIDGFDVKKVFHNNSAGILNYGTYFFAILILGMLMVLVFTKTFGAPYFKFLVLESSREQPLINEIFLIAAFIFEPLAYLHRYVAIEKSPFIPLQVNILPIFPFCFLLFLLCLRKYFIDIFLLKKFMLLYAVSICCMIFAAELFGFTNSKIYELFSAAFYFPVIYIFCCYCLESRYKASTWLLLAAEFVIVLIFLLKRNVWTGHHFIFLHVPIICGLMYFSFNSQQKLRMVLGYLILTMGSTLFLAKLIPFHVESSPSRDRALMYLNKIKDKENYLIQFSSWGGYYIYSLDNPYDRTVSFLEFDEVDFESKLISILTSIKSSNVYNLCYKNCNYFDLSNAYTSSKKIDLIFQEEGGWSIYKVSY